MVQMLIMTGQRLREVAEAEWHEFDLDAGLWEIPPERAKNDERHVVPLAPAVVDLIRDRPKLGKPAKYLFITALGTPVSGFTGAKQKLDEELARLDVTRGGVGRHRDCFKMLREIRRLANDSREVQEVLRMAGIMGAMGNPDLGSASS